ncbi:membrane dipeptidase [Streptomyces sp. NPDC093252]|uniref:membrane dipeptidase n=1 Tax=Streptomyces sp. NPDC093252 TaxID=3154980 RepID=UPI0034331F63
MADLQDELPTTADMPRLTPLPPYEAPSPPPPSPDSDPDHLFLARALLTAHPVADGYSGLPWALRHLPWYDLELGENALDTDIPRLRAGQAGALSCALHLPEGLAADPHPANLPDDLLAEIGAAQGLVMVPLTAEQTGPTVRDVADHLDQVRRVAGPHAVALSGTYDAGTAHPRELPDAASYPYLIAELLRRDWPHPDLALLTWGNIQRVLRATATTARAAQTRRAPSTASIAEPDG